MSRPARSQSWLCPFKLWYLNSNFALTLGYLNPSLNNPAQEIKFLLAETGIQPIFASEFGNLGFVICNLVQGIRNPANDWNSESKFHWQKKSGSSTWNPESTIQECLGFPYIGRKESHFWFHLGQAFPKNTIIIFSVVYLEGRSYQTDALRINWSTIWVIQGSYRFLDTKLETYSRLKVIK